MEQVTQPSKEAFIEWQESEVTRYVMQVLTRQTELLERSSL